MELTSDVRQALAMKAGGRLAALAHGDYLGLSRLSRGRRSEDYFRDQVALLRKPVVLPSVDELDRVAIEERGEGADRWVECSMLVWTEDGPSNLLLINRVRWNDQIRLWKDIDIELRWGSAIPEQRAPSE